MVEMTEEQRALWEALQPEPEPVAHCYDCPNRFGDCAEYTACSSPRHPYDRGHCHWGYETIKKFKEVKNE